MSQHKASVLWKRTGNGFLKGCYSREHTWRFDGGLTVPASPSPLVVPAPWSNPAGVDPEEAFVAAVASCHMLTYLHLASKSGYQVDEYQDDAFGLMTKNERGFFWISRIELSPTIVFSGEKLPDPEVRHGLHHLAHEQCFIANSIKTEVVVKDGNGQAHG